MNFAILCLGLMVRLWLMKEQDLKMAQVALEDQRQAF